MTKIAEFFPNYAVVSNRQKTTFDTRRSLDHLSSATASGEQKTVWMGAVDRMHIAPTQRDSLYVSKTGFDFDVDWGPHTSHLRFMY